MERISQIHETQYDTEVYDMYRHYIHILLELLHSPDLRRPFFLTRPLLLLTALLTR